MGLLDMMNDPQQAGMLSLAAGLLDASGPSTMPRSLGQVLAAGLNSGMNGYNGAINNQQNRLINELKLKELQQAMQDRDAMRQKNMAMQNIANRVFTQSPADAALSRMQGPTNENAQAYQAAQQQQPDMFGQLTAYANELQKAGMPMEAMKIMEDARKLQPEFDTKPQVVNGPNGPMLVQIAKDGTVRPIQGGYAPAEKLTFQDTGGRILGLDPYSGKQMTQYGKSMTPGEIASNNLGRDRLNFEIGKDNGPKFVEGMGGFVTSPTAANPRGTFTALDGVPGAKLNESQGKALAFASRMQNSDKILNALYGQGVENSGAIKRTAEGIGNVLGLGTESMGGALSDAFGNMTNWTQSPQQQGVEQAKRDFVNAILRQESGASISPKEFASAEKQYFPQPGDTPEVIMQKSINRQIAINGMATQAGPGASQIGQPMQGKTATLSDIAATAKASGKTTAQVTADLRARGYQIVGQ